MCCNESNNKEMTQCKRNNGNNLNFVIIIVLYILLAIIIGSCLV